MRNLLAVFAVFLTAFISAAGRAPAAAQLPEKFTNLTILPKDITQPALVSAMRQFVSALGVRCEHCHVGEGNDLSKFDFASDTKPAKNTARKMMQMLVTINQDLLKGVGQPSAAPKVTCYTCHRREAKPATEGPARGGGPAPRG